MADLSLHVGAGEIFGFLGPNGAGKTTAIKMLLALVSAGILFAMRSVAGFFQPACRARCRC